MIKFTIFALLLASPRLGVAVGRQWQSGTWRDSQDVRTQADLIRSALHRIETDTYRLVLEDVVAGDRPSLHIAAGSAVKFAVDKDRVYVLDRSGREHELRLVRRVDLTYAALGSGHYIKAVGANGESVTLEDGSTWELDPGAYFFTAGWKPLDGIAVRTTDPDRGFTYEIDNTDQDNGALARYNPR